MIAYLLKNVIHEGLGHGGACLLVGGKPIAISSAWWNGDYSGVGRWGRRGVNAGGTVANLLVGGGLVAVWPRIREIGSARPVLVYFLWLLLVLNLMSGGGYMMVDPIGGFGDWTSFLEGLEPALPLRASIIAVGIAVSVFALLYGRRTIEPFLGVTDRKRRLRILCWGPYFIGGIAFPLSAAFNPEGRVFVITTALATLGGTAWLAWFLPFIADKPPNGASDERLGVPRSHGWMAAGLGALLFTLFVLGPSIPF